MQQHFSRHHGDDGETTELENPPAAMNFARCGSILTFLRAMYTTNVSLTIKHYSLQKICKMQQPMYNLQ